MLDLFELTPHHDLGVMGRASGLASLTATILAELDPVLEEEAPDRVLVHGDTTTSLAAALAAYYRRIPVGHVEAGLRTGDIHAPWPEEVNRQAVARIADLHFAPTHAARVNLLSEGVAERGVHVTGNTVIDALLWVRDRVLSDAGVSERIAGRFPFLDDDRRMVLITGHRRENFDGGLARVCGAMRRLAEIGDVTVVYPVHMNPVVRDAADRVLGDAEGVHLIPPQDYLEFVWLMGRAHLIVTDSGGIQEEAPSLGKPVLVTRDVTERPEAVSEGTVRLVGTDPDLLLREARRLLMDASAYDAMSRAHNPYGDGAAAGRIVEGLLESHGYGEALTRSA